MTDRIPVRRALLSVSDKTGLVAFARTLDALGVELISTGGTAKTLVEAGLAVVEVADLTGFPEMMDGRVKTLHPAVHGGILALRNNPTHTAAMDEHGIKPIDLVCVNLYPFEETVAREGVTRAQAIEQIDIGGPSMIRSAAKNAAWVAVVTNADQYEAVATELAANEGTTSRAMRDELACAAFVRTSAYDAAISTYLSQPDEVEPFPPRLSLTLSREATLRYGENPHQRAAVYRDQKASGPSIVGATQRGGKALSYNNLLDAAAALGLVQSLASVDAVRTGACVLKHTNPCGAALANDTPGAIRLAIAGDPVAAYGGILAVNGPLDMDAAETIATGGAFFEVVIAPAFDDDAVRVLHERWKNLRLLEVGALEVGADTPMDYRSIPGGMLVQDRDCEPIRSDTWEHEAGPEPVDDDLQSAAFLTACVRALSSNAVVIGGADESGVRIFGAGAGQMDRVNSCRIAVAKAGEKARGAIASSEAFFPFADGPEVLIEAGVRMIVQPGGSKRDGETFAVCEKAGVTCVTTGQRHFRH
jgi:phosphoribosylaminoimidazolecarboxamide formyltransferase / IMP cyclohydrolase